jgi:hypothetical protein
MLDPFIDDLRRLVAKQQEAINDVRDRRSLAPIIDGLQRRVDYWNTLVETGLAFKNRNLESTSK